MAAAIKFRENYDGPASRGLAKQTKDAAQGRLLLALAEVYDGGSRNTVKGWRCPGSGQNYGALSID